MYVRKVIHGRAARLAGSLVVVILGACGVDLGSPPGDGSGSLARAENVRGTSATSRSGASRLTDGVPLRTATRRLARSTTSDPLSQRVTVTETS